MEEAPKLLKVEAKVEAEPEPEPEIEPVKKEKVKVQRRAASKKIVEEAPKEIEEAPVKKEKAKYETDSPPQLLIFPKTHVRGQEPHIFYPPLDHF